MSAKATPPVASSAGAKKEDAEDYEARIEELDRMIDDFMGRPDLHNSSDETKARLLKKRNALYSQRKYYRKKLKIDKLECERDDFIDKNSKLRKENQIFERMLACAQEQVHIRRLLESRGSRVTEIDVHDPLVSMVNSASSASKVPTASWEVQRNLNGGVSSRLQNLLRSRDELVGKKAVASALSGPSVAQSPSAKPATFSANNGSSRGFSLLPPAQQPLSAQLLRNAMMQQLNPRSRADSIEEVLLKLERAQQPRTNHLPASLASLDFNDRLASISGTNTSRTPTRALEALLLAKHGFTNQF